ncbi:MAG: hypothetical protein OEM99_12475 [Gammaproteobacteria bacterium]|nr:hypothetical protein [Gammaproteobacteria bacterium]
MDKLLANIVQRSPVALIVFATLIHADDDCTFSRTAMLTEIKQIANEHARTSIDTEKLRATWTLEDGNTEYYEVGGCYDYGKAAGRITQLARKRNTEAAIRVAMELARKYLTSTDLKLLSDAIESESVERETSGAEDFFFVAHPIGEIVISHTFSDGFDTVEISWSYL